MKNKGDIYDTIIIGSGPAGLTAGIYAGRYKLKTLIIGQIEGGLITEAHKICNFPSEQEIDGFGLVEKMKAHVIAQETIIKNGKIIDIQRHKNDFTLKLSNGDLYTSKTILLATGTEHRKLNLEKEDNLIGHGVSYCATCDGMFYKDKVVSVVGGSDSALTAALYLSEIAKKVYLIYRGKKLRGEPIWIEKVSQCSNIEIVLETNIEKLTGEDKLESIYLDKPYLGNKEIILAGLFVEIGTEPKTSNFIKNLDISLNKQNYIQVEQSQKTSCSGIWAAGDITTNSNNFKQIITACAEGAVAAENIFHYIMSKSTNN